METRTSVAGSLLIKVEWKDFCGNFLGEGRGGGHLISLYNHITDAEYTTLIYTKLPPITSFFCLQHYQ